MRYDIGGRRKRDGWQTIDADPRVKPDIVSTLPPVPEQCRGAQAFQLIHVLEHFHVWEARALLRQFYEMLKPGGVLILELPNLDSAIGALSGNGKPLDRWGMWVLYGDPSHRNPLYGHKWAWNPSTLRRALIEAGFTADNVQQERPKHHVPDRDMRFVSTK